LNNLGYERRALKFIRPIGIVCCRPNFANARCKNIIKIDLGTHNFQQFLATINQHYGMRCSSYTGGKRTARAVVSAGRPGSLRTWQRINKAARLLTTFIMAKVVAYSQYAVCIDLV
jgi:hypothetical protein